MDTKPKASRGFSRAEKLISAIIVSVAVLSCFAWAWSLHEGAQFARCVDEQKAAGVQPNC